MVMALDLTSWFLLLAPKLCAKRFSSPHHFQVSYLFDLLSWTNSTSNFLFQHILAHLCVPGLENLINLTYLPREKTMFLLSCSRRKYKMTLLISFRSGLRIAVSCRCEETKCYVFDNSW